MAQKVGTAPVGYAADVLMTDGTIAQIRDRRDSDCDDLIALHRDASEESFYRRFFGLHRGTADEFVRRLSRSDRRGLDLVASAAGRIVGIVTVEEIAADRGEVALFVADEFHGRGIGTLLLEHAAALGRARGLTTLKADVLAVNSPMLQMFYAAGFEVTTSQDSYVVEVTLTNRLTEQAWSAADLRERSAEKASLRPVFEPDSVAVVGVSRSSGVGRAIVERIVTGHYAGRLYAVNPHGVDIPGAVGVARLADIPHPPDLVVVAVPSALVERVVEEAAQIGARAAVVITAGFAEDGADGQAAQARIVSTARAANMRIVGPNCFGVFSTLRQTRLDATFSAARSTAGRLAIGSQSGGVGMAILGDATARGAGVAAFVSLGNKADVSGNDLLAAWTDDPDIEAVALYLESFGNPRKFVRMARACGLQKPVLAVFGGSSAAGRRAGVSHTAGSLTSERFLRALCETAGVIAVTSPTALLDAAELLMSQPIPAGSRVGIVGNAGGLGILAADAADREALVVPDSAEAAEAAEPTDGSGHGVIANPYDLGAGATPQAFAEAVTRMAADDRVDSLVVVVAATAVTDLDAVVDAVRRAVDDGPHIPCALVVVGADRPPAGPFATYSSVDSAIGAVARASEYGSWLRRQSTETAESDGPSRDVQEWLRQAAVASSGELLDARTTLDALDRLGIDQPAYRLLDADGEPRTAAAEIGYPIVAKVCRTGIAHKTDLGFVTRDLRDGDATAAAVRQLRTVSGFEDPILLQGQSPAGVELAIGLVNDPRVGPLLMISTGGVELELWADQVYLVAPVSEQRVRSALRSLRSWPLLRGFRGAAPADVDAFVRLAVLVSQLGDRLPEVAELDLNPVIVGTDGVSCVDAKIRLQPVDLNLDGAPALSRARTGTSTAT
jgi:acyl-CoA synthetase (NDP forming)/GNAT superfamily N-acetyltransferase